MSVLKYKKKEDKLQFTGVNLSPAMKRYITLFSLANGVPQSVVIRDQLVEWMTTSLQTHPVELLLEKIAKACRQHWLESKKGEGNLSFSKYKKDLQAELLAKGLDQEHVETIIEILENGKNE